jgi:TolA-binding protein
VKARDTAPATAVAARGSEPRVAEPSSAALFADANRARASGDSAGAIRLYRQLQQRFPRSSEAALSELTLATLLLHTGDARSALNSFDNYLGRGSRPLDAEALVGRALSLRALGQRDQEVVAWRSVIDRYPGSSYARRAAERLAALRKP